MPFGKYAGWEIEELPDSYLEWLHTTAEIHSSWLREAIAKEYGTRLFGYRSHERAAPESAVATLDGIVAGRRELFMEVVECGYRKLALQRHPDHGGSTEQMRELNNLVEALRQHSGAKRRKSR